MFEFAGNLDGNVKIGSLTKVASPNYLLFPLLQVLAHFHQHHSHM